MQRSTKKFVAVFIAIWLPLFSGNALAVSVAMQVMSGADHAVVAMEGEQCPHHVLNHDQSAGLQDQQNAGCGSTGICHLACCGYMATASIKVPVDQPFALSFAPASNQFQSIALTPLDPPPLARV